MLRSAQDDQPGTLRQTRREGRPHHRGRTRPSRAQAVLFAKEGADLVLVDICEPLSTIPYPLAEPGDLDETAKLAGDYGASVLSRIADVRDSDAINSAVAAGLDAHGRIDVVAANAGVLSYGRAWEFTDDQWSQVLDTVLTGIFKTVRAVVPSMIERGGPGSIVLNSSTAGLMAAPGIAHYAAAKHGVVGYARSLAIELAPHEIRVNTIHPAGTDTAMVRNEATYRTFRPDLDKPTAEDAIEVFRQVHVLPVGLMDPMEIAKAVLWFASDDARYVTEVALPVDAGAGQK